MNYMVREGDYQKMGAIASKEGITFTFAAEQEDVCSIIIYHGKDGIKEEVPVENAWCRGCVRSVFVKGLKAREVSYMFRINGRLQEDPYARRLFGREIWNQKRENQTENGISCGFITAPFNWKEDVNPEIPKAEMFIYKLHVRGFSMGNPTIGKNKGTFKAVQSKIPYFKELGITTLELMPVYEFEERPVPAGEEKVNFWGYGPGNYFAPKASYGSEPLKADIEFKRLIRTLHANGMECIMEMCFPTEVPRGLIEDALEYWTKEYHVDGFHLLGAHLPVASLVQNPRLGRTKLFVDEYYGFPNTRKQKNLFVLKDEYLYPARKLLNGYEGDIRDFLDQQKKQNADFGFVNYLASNNGFTLEDVFCYEEKHNEANGENNADGPEFNFSNNYGVEGLTTKRSVQRKRASRKNTALTMLFLAQGVPLLQAGDEFANSQMGNNNAYCQDNEIGWLDWKNFSRTASLRKYIRKLADFRKEYPVIAGDNPFRFYDYGAKGMPDISYHGEYAWLSQVDPGMESIGLLYNGAYSPKAGYHPDVYVGYNFGDKPVKLALPKGKWTSFLEKDRDNIEDRYVSVAPYDVCILLAKQEQ